MRSRQFCFLFFNQIRGRERERFKISEVVRKAPETGRVVPHLRQQELNTPGRPQGATPARPDFPREQVRVGGAGRAHPRGVVGGAPASPPPPPRSPPTSLSRRLPGGRDLSGGDARGEEEPAGWPPSRDDARTPLRPEPAPGRQAHGPARVSGSGGLGAAAGPAMSPLFSWVAKVGGGGGGGFRATGALQLPNRGAGGGGRQAVRASAELLTFHSFLLSAPRPCLPEGVAPVPRLGRLRHSPRASSRCSPSLWDRPCCPGSSLLGAAGVGRRGCCQAFRLLTCWSEI